MTPTELAAIKARDAAGKCRKEAPLTDLIHRLRMFNLSPTVQADAAAALEAQQKEIERSHRALLIERGKLEKADEENERLRGLLANTRNELVSYIGGIPERRFAIGRALERIDAAMAKS